MRRKAHSLWTKPRSRYRHHWPALIAADSRKEKGGCPGTRLFLMYFCLSAYGRCDALPHVEGADGEAQLKEKLPARIPMGAIRGHTAKGGGKAYTAPGLTACRQRKPQRTLQHRQRQIRLEGGFCLASLHNGARFIDTNGSLLTGDHRAHQKLHRHGIERKNARADGDHAVDAPLAQRLNIIAVLNRNYTSGYTEFLQKHGYLEQFRKEMAPALRAGPTPYAPIISSMPQELDQTSYLASHTLDWLKNRARNKPFFAIFGPAKPHYPFQCDKTWHDYYADKTPPARIKGKLQAFDQSWAEWIEERDHHGQLETLTEEMITEIKRVYYAMISLVDQKVGEIIALLEKDGSLDNTWIIYGSDHGDMMWDHGIPGKFVFHFTSVGVPCIIRPPKGKAKIAEVSLPTESFCLNPTLLEIAGLPPLPGTPARSLLPLMNAPAPSSSLAFAEVSGDHNNTPYFAAVTDGTHRLTMDARARHPVEFYDLKNDPDESYNLVRDAKRQKIITEMMDGLLKPHIDKLPS
jgi:arylsulfatase A-like enzyme